MLPHQGPSPEVDSGTVLEDDLTHEDSGPPAAAPLRLLTGEQIHDVIRREQQARYRRDIAALVLAAGIVAAIIALVASRTITLEGAELLLVQLLVLGLAYGIIRRR